MWKLCVQRVDLKLQSCVAYTTFFYEKALQRDAVSKMIWGDWIKLANKQQGCCSHM